MRRPLRRADLLQLADMSVTAYNALTNRDLMPFTVERPREKWSTYSEEEVIRLSLLKGLTRAGMPQPEAVDLIRNHFIGLERLGETIAADERKSRLSPLLFGSATFLIGTEGDELVVPIISTVEKLGRATKDACPTKDGRPARLVRVVTVSATRCMEEIFDRAGDRRRDPEMLAWAKFLRVHE